MDNNKTQQQIFQELLIQYPLLYDNKNGENIQMSNEQRISILQEWANNIFDAQTPQIRGFVVSPENIILGIESNDESEFNKLITLLTLGLQQNKLLPTTEITIWDYIKTPHAITVQRFLEIMVDYGMYCYSQRS
jgi:hypothetical protein